MGAADEGGCASRGGVGVYGLEGIGLFELAMAP